MYCNNCGKFLLENDKFCSNCGTRVFLNEQSIEKESPLDDLKPDDTQDLTPKPTAPVDNIKWNIEDFPDHDVKKTEEINFDWGNTSDFRKTELTAEEIALNLAQKADESKPTEGGFIATQIIEEVIIQGKDLEEEIFAEASLVESIPTGGEIHKRNKIVDKFYTFNKKNEEFQKLLDQEYEKIKEGTTDGLDDQAFRDSVSKINQKSDETWSEFNPTEHIAEMAIARERFFGPMANPYKETKPEEKPTLEESPSINEVPINEVPIDEVPIDEVPIDEVPIDEASEEVLEPTGLPGEEPLPENNILPDLEICKDEQTMPAQEEVTCAPIEPISTETFSTPLEEDVIPEDFEDPKPEVSEPDEPKATVEPVVVKADDDVFSIRDKWVEYEEESDDDDEDQHSGSKIGKFIIGFLILLLLTQVALLGVKLVAPESAVAQFVDEKVQQIILFFQGSDNTSQAAVTNRNIAADNKTGLIQMQIDKNYNGNIAVIKYNENLRLNTAKDYSDTSLNMSTVLQDNKWYTKDDGNNVYYDDQAIGTTISYESARSLAEGESFATLEIGEIRISGENIYVWVAEEITPGDRQEKILRITVSGETMNVNTEYDV